MRDIKFRVWDKWNETYFYPINLDALANVIGLLSASDNGYILEQFTGLTDKNGRDIYEGDLYTAYDSDVRQIFYKSGAFCGGEKFEQCVPVAWAFHEDETNEIHDDVTWINTKVEVIGNIYENPELLK